MQMQGSQIKMMQTEDLIVRYEGPAKLDMEIKPDWLLFHFRNEITWTAACFHGQVSFFLVRDHV